MHEGCTCEICATQKAVADVIEKLAARPGGARFDQIEAALFGACAAVFMTIADKEERTRQIESFARVLPSCVEFRRELAVDTGQLVEGGRA